MQPLCLGAEVVDERCAFHEDGRAAHEGDVLCFRLPRRTLRVQCCLGRLVKSFYFDRILLRWQPHARL